MACTHPLKAFVVGIDCNGKKIIKFANRKYGDNDIKVYDDGTYFSTEYIEIPCGQCVACRLQYSRKWADRCMMELMYHDSAYFVTLTYSDEYLNRGDQVGNTRRYYADESTGEAKVSLSLSKRDLTLFWKRLRKEFKIDKIRYYACGEYGDQTKRPHYHCIIFGLHLNDLKVYKVSGLKNVYYNSDRLQKVWSIDGQPIGHVVVGDVTWETCAYTARYVMKKAKGMTAESYAQFNMQPEFVVMSRKPGIGRDYYEDHRSDFLEFGETYIGTKTGSVNCKTPRYFKSLMDDEFHDQFKSMKEMQVAHAKDNVKAKLSMSDLCLDELREVEEAALIMRTKALKREI